MAFSDQECLLLEQLTYLDASVYNIVNLKIDSSKSTSGHKIEEILSDFSRSKLDELATHSEPIGSTHTSGKEWAQLIHAIKKDQYLATLVRTNDKLTIDVKEHNG